MSDTPEPNPDQTAAFAKLWSESCGRLMQAAMTYSPETAPPELLRQIRGGIMQALSQSWEEFLRSPQFLEGMKNMMDQAVAFRKLSVDFLTKARHDTEGVAHADIETLRAALVQTETRLARQIEALAGQISQLANGSGKGGKDATRPSPAPPKPARKRKPSFKVSAANKRLGQGKGLL